MASHSNAQTPISRHPLFPTMVALWFAALLGLGSLAIRASVLERVVLALHLDLVIPAAAPPLGFTARMLLSLVLTCGGGLLGFVLARRLGRAAPAASARRATTGRARTASAAPVVVPAATDSATFDDGEDLARLDAARAELPRRRRALTAGDDTPPDVSPLTAAVPADPDPAPRILTVGDLESMPPLQAPADPASNPITSQTPAAAPVLAAERRPAPPPALTPLPLATTAPVDGTAALRLRQAPLDSLGVVELVERFALALAARQSRPATEASAPAASPPPPFAQPALERPALDWPALDRPALAQPDDWGGDDADLPEDEFSSLLDMKPPVRPTIALADEQAGVLAQPVVLFPGQVPHNGHALAPGAAFGSNPVQTEQALRDALAALQRMSGAA